MEVPIGRTSTGGRGRILEVHTSQIVLGRRADAFDEHRRGLQGPYTERDPFHDPFVLFAHLAGLTALIHFEHRDCAQAPSAEAWLSDEGVARQANR